MKNIVGLLALLISSAANAELGIAIHFSINKNLGKENKTYTNAVLMRLNEAVTFSFPSQYMIRLQTRDLGGREESIVASVDDVSTGDVVYVGSTEMTAPVGSTQRMTLRDPRGIATVYEIVVDTAYGKLIDGHP